jgi:para-aminobenzoate synthetase/4-amino-4-deoxychorismate lyase
MMPLTLTPPFALFDDALAPAGEAASWLFTDRQRSIELRHGADFAAEFAAACAAVEAATAAGCYVACAFAYELGHALEPAAGPLAEGSWLACFHIFAQAERLTASQVEALLAPQRGPAGIAELNAALSPAEYGSALARIGAYIAAGDCYQVNFTFPLSFTAYGSPLALYARLRDRQPTQHAALLVDERGATLSLSPELFLSRQGERLLTRPMKGTAPRGSDAASDAANRAALLASPKDRAENLMIVDLLRNDLGRVARTGSVKVDALFDAEAYPTVWQLTSTVSAALPVTPAVPLADLLRALFPCGSITGAPKVRAMQIIKELEATPRGIYTGALGWLLPGGDFSFNVAIRTLSIDAAGRGTMGVGGGIVADSEAAAEYRECQLKAQFLSRLDPGLQLIETLLLENGGYPRLAGHRRRLARSAEALGFAVDMDVVERELAAVAAAQGQGRWRVRLTVNHAGQPVITVAALDANPAAAQPLLLSAQRIAADDYLLRHKTTARAVYDAELQQAMAAGAFDALFLNEHDEVCEGARSNVFARIDGRLLTPPLACGLLPGVLREELLLSGAAVEARLTLADLRRAEALYCGNALRGLVEVLLVA